jgi:hypothetical protein
MRTLLQFLGIWILACVGIAFGIAYIERLVSLFRSRQRTR